jgi:hypothetical protein
MAALSYWLRHRVSTTPEVLKRFPRWCAASSAMLGMFLMLLQSSSSSNIQVSVAQYLLYMKCGDKSLLYTMLSSTRICLFSAYVIASTIIVTIFELNSTLTVTK